RGARTLRDLGGERGRARRAAAGPLSAERGGQGALPGMEEIAAVIWSQESGREATAHQPTDNLGVGCNGLQKANHAMDVCSLAKLATHDHRMERCPKPSAVAGVQFSKRRMMFLQDVFERFIIVIVTRA